MNTISTQTSLVEPSSSLSGHSTINPNLHELKSYLFHLGGLHFLIEPGKLFEIVTDIAFTPLSGAPPHFKGLVNVRGNILPLYDLQLFSQDETSSPLEHTQTALLVGDAQQGFLLALNEMPIPIAFSQLKAFTTDIPKPEVFDYFIKRGYLYQDNPIWVLDDFKLGHFLVSVEYEE